MRRIERLVIRIEIVLDRGPRPVVEWNRERETVMTFEEKKNRAFEESFYSCIPDENVTETIRGAFDLAWDRARQETLREVIPVLKTISNVEATDSLAEMQDVVKAVKTLTTSLLHKLEAERENSDM